MELIRGFENMQRTTTTEQYSRDTENREYDGNSDDDGKLSSGDDDSSEGPDVDLLRSKERFSMSCPLDDDTNSSDFVSTSVVAFDPFATICDDDDDDDNNDDPNVDNTVDKKDAVDETIFDPWQTIHDDDDAFTVSAESAKPHNGEGVSRLSSEDICSSDVQQANSLDGKTTINRSRTFSDDETSVYEPLEPFHIVQTKTKWNLWVRLPLAMRGKLLLNQSRYWKPVLVKLLNLGSHCVVRLYNDFAERDLLHELSLLPTNSIYNEGLQVVDHATAGPKFNICTLYDIKYEERLSVLSNSKIFPKFRDITSINSFQQFRNLIHKMPKVSMMVRHVPDHTELLKFGSRDPEDIRQFQRVVEDAFFQQEFQRQPLCKYNREELHIEVIDEYYARLNYQGKVSMHKARVRIFCAAFLSCSSAVEIGLNDDRRNGQEVVRRQDIVPLEIEEWINIEDVELNHCVSQKDFAKRMVVRFQPPDGCRYELMRYRIRPIVDRELPLRVCGQTSIINRHVHIRCELNVPAYFLAGERIDRMPCRNIEVRIPIPDSWVYLFHVERLYRCGVGVTQVKKIPGAVKGLELLSLFSQGILQPSMINVSTGSAQYEDLFKAIMWKIDALPGIEEDVYRTHTFALHFNLGPQDSISDYRNRTAYINFHMSNYSISRTQVRSVSIEHLGDYKQGASVSKKIEKSTHYEYKVDMAFFSDTIVNHNGQGLKKNLTENENPSSEDEEGSLLINDSDIEELENSSSSY